MLAVVVVQRILSIDRADNISGIRVVLESLLSLLSTDDSRHIVSGGLQHGNL